MTPVFGLLKEAESAFAELVHNCLLVAGGFLVGYLAGMAAGWAVGRYVFKQRDNTVLKKLGGLIGGLVLALIVALLVFTGRGKGPGTGGDGKGSPATDSPDKASTPKADPNVKVPPKLDPLTAPEVKPADVTIPVTLYGGSKVADSRHYRLEDEGELRNFDGLKQAVLDRQKREKGKIALAIRLPPDRQDHPGDPRVITQLTEWANAQGFDVTFPAKK